jgi:hypothetical protein
LLVAGPPAARGYHYNLPPAASLSPDFCFVVLLFCCFV